MLTNTVKGQKWQRDNEGMVRERNRHLVWRRKSRTNERNVKNDKGIANRDKGLWWIMIGREWRTNKKYFKGSGRMIKRKKQMKRMREKKERTWISEMNKKELGGERRKKGDNMELMITREKN